MNGDDYVVTDLGMSGSLSGWMWGDFNYDEITNGDDYVIMDLVYGAQGSLVAPATDTDGDGLPDCWEAEFGLNPHAAADAGKMSAAGCLTNLQTFLAGINPRTIDFDGDNLPDWWEVQFSLDPEDPADAGQDWDRDRATNLQEYAARTHSLDLDDHPPQPGIPAAPENVRVVSNPDGSSDIYWDDVSDNETYFVIRDRLPNGTVIELGRGGPDATHFHIPAP